MQILRHSQIAVTMDIYSQVTSSSTRETLTKLGTRLTSGGRKMTRLLQLAAAGGMTKPLLRPEKGL